MADFFDNEFWQRPENMAARDAFKRYVKLHQEAMEHPLAATSRFIGLVPVAESGNRMLALVSCFIMALLTDR